MKLVRKYFSYSKEDIYYNFYQNRWYLPPLNFMGNDVVLSISPLKALIGVKKDYVTITKTGSY